MCLRGSSGEVAPFPRKLPSRIRTVRQVDELTTRYFRRLFIDTENSECLAPLYGFGRPNHLDAPEGPLVVTVFGYFQPMRARKLLIWAAWWRECQAYSASVWSSRIGPRSAWRKVRFHSSSESPVSS